MPISAPRFASVITGIFSRWTPGTLTLRCLGKTLDAWLAGTLQGFVHQGFSSPSLLSGFAVGPVLGALLPCRRGYGFVPWQVPPLHAAAARTLEVGHFLDLRTRSAGHPPGRGGQGLCSHGTVTCEATRRPSHAALAAACSCRSGGGSSPGQSTVPGPVVGGSYGPCSFLVFGVVLGQHAKTKKQAWSIRGVASPQTSSGIVGLVRITHQHPHRLPQQRDTQALMTSHKMLWPPAWWLRGRIGSCRRALLRFCALFVLCFSAWHCFR